MESSYASQSSGFFTSMLTVLFIGLKLTGNITWSWWWVLGPCWIPLAVLAVIALIAAGVKAAL